MVHENTQQNFEGFSFPFSGTQIYLMPKDASILNTPYALATDVKSAPEKTPLILSQPGLVSSTTCQGRCTLLYNLILQLSFFGDHPWHCPSLSFLVSLLFKYSKYSVPSMRWFGELDNVLVLRWRLFRYSIGFSIHLRLSLLRIFFLQNSGQFFKSLKNCL